MNHPFLSCRRETYDLCNATSFLSAVVCINGASTEDIAHIMNREDVLVKDKVVRNYLSKHASYVGCLLDKIEKVAVEQDICKQGTLTHMNTRWHARLRGAVPLDTHHLNTLNGLAKAFDVKKQELSTIEGVDCGSTSPSDYSDSETHSTDDEDDDGTDDDGTDDDGTDDDDDEDDDDEDDDDEDDDDEDDESD